MSSSLGIPSPSKSSVSEHKHLAGARRGRTTAATPGVWVAALGHARVTVTMDTQCDGRGWPALVALIFAAWLCVVAAPAAAELERHHVRPSPFRQDQFDLLDHSGRRLGIIRPNPFRPEELELDAPDGEPKLRIRPDPFRPGEWRIEER